MCLLQWLAWNHALQRARDAPDPTVVWMPKSGNPLAALFGGGDAPAGSGADRTTRGAVEADRAEKQLSSAQMSPLIIMGMSFLGNIHMPCVLQTILIPLTLLEDAQLRRVFFGAEPQPGVAMYGEVFQDPALPAPAPAAAVALVGTAPGAKGEVSTAVALEEAVYGCWEAGATEGVPVDALVQLNDSKSTPAEVRKVRQGVVWGYVVVTSPSTDAAPGVQRHPLWRFRTQGEGWTVLMVSAANQNTTPSELARLAGVVVAACGSEALSVVDKDGWTALHWAAFHGCVAGVEALCGAVAAGEAQALVRTVTGQGASSADGVPSKPELVGKTALQLAAAAPLSDDVRAAVTAALRRWE